MQGKLFYWALTTALAGLLFGFDTVVISGAEARIQNLWSLSGFWHGIAISSAIWGTVLGALTGGIPAQKIGRKRTLIYVGALYLVSAIGSAYAWNVSSFIFFRFIGGLGIGIATVASPMFIAEISPAQHRGKLTALFQFNIVLGILLAFISNLIIGSSFDESWAWRWMLGVEAVPAFFYMVMCFGLPESPRWLIVEKGDDHAGRAIFEQVNPTLSPAEIDNLVAEVKTSAEEARIMKENKAKFFSRRLRYPILFAFLIAAFNQLSGINIILYFAPRLLDLAGISNPLLAAACLGVTNLIFTYVGVMLIDRLGRRTLLLIGCIGYIISLGVCTWAFVNFSELKVVSAATDAVNAVEQVVNLDNPDNYITDSDRQEILANYQAARQNLVLTATPENYQGPTVSFDEESTLEDVKNAALQAKGAASEELGSVSSLVLLCMILFIASHAFGSGTIIWVFISEIFPNDQRAAGQSLGSSTHWVFAAGLTLIFPIVMANFDVSVVFGFFTLMMIIQILWAKFQMPETKGRTLEELSKSLLTE